MNTIKQCKTCKIEKPLDNFKINQVKCIECNEKIAVFRNRRHNVAFYNETGFDIISDEGLNNIKNEGCSVEYINYSSSSVERKFRNYSTIFLKISFYMRLILHSRMVLLKYFMLENKKLKIFIYNKSGNNTRSSNYHIVFINCFICWYIKI